MSELRRLVDANREYVDDHLGIADAEPRRHLAVVTCMDARIDVFAALGLELGDAHVIRNAGGRVTDDVLRSLALSSHALGVDSVVVMQHTRCGLAGVSNAELEEVTGSGIDFFCIDDHVETLRTDLQKIRDTPYLSVLSEVAGFVHDIDPGHITEIVEA
ncbi:MAG: carbonic anhydrase [Actinobacteria bacterium]|nr:carbonic anhydrase [Actinomycetota bacterium]